MTGIIRNYSFAILFFLLSFLMGLTLILNMADSEPAGKELIEDQQQAVTDKEYDSDIHVNERYDQTASTVN